MRRAVVELQLSDLRGRSPDWLLGRVESLEVIHYLRCDNEGFAGVCKLRPRNPKFRGRDLVGPGGASKISVLSEDKADGTLIVYIESDPASFDVFGGEFRRVYVGAPIEIRDGKMNLGFIGEANEIRRLFRRLEKLGVPLRVESITDAGFDPSSPLSSLTEKQRRVLLSAYELGYFDFPRRIKSEQLAQRVGLDKSTVAEHLRKAERRLIAKVMTA